MKLSALTGASPGRQRRSVERVAFPSAERFVFAESASHQSGSNGLADSMSLFPILYAAVMLCFGITFFLIPHRIARWPAVPGTIAESYVRVVPPSEQPRSGWGGPKTDRYEPVIVYDYVVEGTAYRGRKLEYAAGWEPELAIAEAVVAAYPVGRAVRVLFNPAKPRDAYLRPTDNVRGAAWFCVIVAVAVMVVHWW